MDLAQKSNKAFWLISCWLLRVRRANYFAGDGNEKEILYFS